MALPAHLAKYEGLIDLVVEQLVREIEEGAEIKKAAGAAPAASVTIATPTTEHNHDQQHIARAPSAATSRNLIHSDP